MRTQGVPHTKDIGSRGSIFLLTHVNGPNKLEFALR